MRQCNSKPLELFTGYNISRHTIYRQITVLSTELDLHIDEPMFTCYTSKSFGSHSHSDRLSFADVILGATQSVEWEQWIPGIRFTHTTLHQQVVTILCGKKKRTCASIHYVERYKTSSSACTDEIPQKQPNDTRIHSHHPSPPSIFPAKPCVFCFWMQSCTQILNTVIFQCVLTV